MVMGVCSFLLVSRAWGTVSVKCWAAPNAFPVEIVEPFPLLDYVLCSLICKEQANPPFVTQSHAHRNAYKQASCWTTSPGL